MKNLNQRLNDLLAAPIRINDRFRGCYLFKSASECLNSLLVIGWDGTVGIARSQSTNYTVVFTVVGTAKPLAKRNYRAELDLNVCEIDTVASTDGIILGAFGESRGRGWRVVG